MIRLLSRKADGTFDFTEFDEGSVPPYAILSHCWSLNQEQDEVTYKDVCGDGGGREKRGYRKLQLCARWAERDGLRYFWIDTCCMNRTESAELNEAVTSMYRWYAEAVKCYAYLEDVTKSVSGDSKSHSKSGRREHSYSKDLKVPTQIEQKLEGLQRELSKMEDEATVGKISCEANTAAVALTMTPELTADNITKHYELESLNVKQTLAEDTRWKLAFQDCKWFTRGWTLQELLAPPSVEFFSSDELRLGDRVTLSHEICEATGIPVAVLEGRSSPWDFNIAERKSWVQSRKTRRPEDTAYCLMGIFDISIFIMYGEGKKRAHARLDEAIERTYGQQVHGVSRTSGYGWSRWIAALLVAILAIGLASRFAVPGSQTTAFHPEVDASLPVFAILGKTGVGKSSFIKTLGGHNIKTGKSPSVCDGLESCTDEISLYKADLPFGQVYLLDTPGFDDGKGRDDTLVLNMIFEELKRLYDGDKLLKGIIYLYDISAPRIGGMTARVLIKIQQLCGLNGLGNLMLVTTRWTNPLDQAELSNQLKREQNLTDHYWKYARKHGSSIERYRGTKESASAILGILNNRERLFDPTGPLRELVTNLDQQENFDTSAANPFAKSTRLDEPLGTRPLSSLVWDMTSADDVCSYPWWTVLVVLLKAILVIVSQALMFAGSWGVGDELMLGSQRRTEQLSQRRRTEGYDLLGTAITLACPIAAGLVPLVFGSLLGTEPIGRLKRLTGDCQACWMSYLSVHNYSALLFRFMTILAFPISFEVTRRLRRHNVELLAAVFPLVVVFLQIKYVW